MPSIGIRLVLDNYLAYIRDGNVTTILLALDSELSGVNLNIIFCKVVLTMLGLKVILQFDVSAGKSWTFESIEYAPELSFPMEPLNCEVWIAGIGFFTF